MDAKKVLRDLIAEVKTFQEQGLNANDIYLISANNIEKFKRKLIAVENLLENKKASMDDLNATSTPSSDSLQKIFNKLLNQNNQDSESDDDAKSNDDADQHQSNESDNDDQDSNQDDYQDAEKHEHDDKAKSRVAKSGDYYFLSNHDEEPNDNNDNEEDEFGYQNSPAEQKKREEQMQEAQKALQEAEERLKKGIYEDSQKKADQDETDILNAIDPNSQETKEEPKSSIVAPPVPDPDKSIKQINDYYEPKSSTGDELYDLLEEQKRYEEQQKDLPF